MTEENAGMKKKTGLGFTRLSFWKNDTGVGMEFAA
jgi:hypothetical protein